MAGTTMRAVTGLTIATVMTGVAVAGCGRSTVAGRPGCCTAPISRAVPEGWKTATFDNVAISVPDNWVVDHGTNCPDGQAPGSLLLGFPKTLDHCPEIPASISYVAVSALPGGASQKVPEPAPVTRIDVVPVYPGSRYSGSFDWVVPSLGVEVSGTGRDADRILATLRRT